MKQEASNQKYLLHFKVIISCFILFLFAILLNKIISTNSFSSYAGTEESVDYSAIVPEGKPRLLFGNANLSDEDAYVITIFGDGFTESEQENFFLNARTFATYFLSESPFNELKSIIKIYALGVVSNTNTIQGDNNDYTPSQVKDTYFQTKFNVSGISRLMGINYDGEQRLIALRNTLCPYTDQTLMLANATKYGGGGGRIAIASINDESKYIMIHEFAHSSADLGDEYW